jgi:hypothetical protein
MSAKYSLLVVALVVAILTVNSLWVKHHTQRSSSNEQSQIRSES